MKCVIKYFNCLEKCCSMLFLKCLKYASLDNNKKLEFTMHKNCNAHTCKCEILGNLISVCLIITPYWLTRFKVYTAIIQLCLHVYNCACVWEAKTAAWQEEKEIREIQKV